MYYWDDDHWIEYVLIGLGIVLGLGILSSCISGCIILYQRKEKKSTYPAPVFIAGQPYHQQPVPVYSATIQTTNQAGTISQSVSANDLQTAQVTQSNPIPAQIPQQNSAPSESTQSNSSPPEVPQTDPVLNRTPTESSITEVQQIPSTKTPPFIPDIQESTSISNRYHIGETPDHDPPPSYHQVDKL